jgi:hypothetical protein
MTRTSLVASASSFPAFSGHHLLDPGVEVGIACLALDEVIGGALGRSPPLGQTEQPQPRGVAVDDVKRLLPDGSCRPEDRNVDGTRHWSM